MTEAYRTPLRYQGDMALFLPSCEGVGLERRRRIGEIIDRLLETS